jgi:hypothetical protein
LVHRLRYQENPVPANSRVKKIKEKLEYAGYAFD